MNLFWHKILQDKLALISLGIILSIILLGVFAPLVAFHDPIMPNLNNKFAKWSFEYPFGTDHLGRCVFSRLIYGIRTTLFLSFLTVFIVIGIGTIFGVIAAFFKPVEELIMRICDILLSFPSTLLILTIVGVLGVGIENIIIASIIAKLAWYIRMIYSYALSYKEKNYIYFSKVSGVSSWKILKKHLFPAIANDITMLATLDMGHVILSISALSFLGLGVGAPTPEWGMMLSEAKSVMSIAPMQMLPAGFAILTIVASFNFLGDSLRDANDPQYFKQIKSFA